jgi:cytosine/adenosine deaminase-related metal-dependent hydrolase
MSLTRVLLKGATLVTMDDILGDLPDADILIDSGRIVAVGPSLQHGDAEVVPLAGKIVIPGLVNAHMHTWQTGLRSIAANWTLLQYFRWMHAGLATCFAPEDIFCATLVGALNQINCGTTTIRRRPIRTQLSTRCPTQASARASCTVRPSPTRNPDSHISRRSRIPVAKLNGCCASDSRRV